RKRKRKRATATDARRASTHAPATVIPATMSELRKYTAKLPSVITYTKLSSVIPVGSSAPVPDVVLSENALMSMKYTGKSVKSRTAATPMSRPRGPPDRANRTRGRDRQTYSSQRDSSLGVAVRHLQGATA